MTLATDLDTAAALPLSRLLREATAAQHRRAETTPFISTLMNGRLNRDAYIHLARQHHCIYQALENAGKALLRDPVATAFVLPELDRTAALEDDLTVLAGPDWRTAVDVLPVTEEYAARLRRVAARWAGYYLAHAYTRYLGDLSGGQVVRTMLQRHYDLRPSELGFYQFSDIPKPKPFKDAYRAAMDAAAFTASEKAEIARECAIAFDLNTDLFTALGAVHRPTQEPLDT